MACGLEPHIQLVSEMQEKISVRNGSLCKDTGQLPFRCPRCGERERFRSLSALRAHLDHRHTYHTVHDLSPISRWRPADVLQDLRKAKDASCIERCKSSSVEKRCSVDSLGNENRKLTVAALSLGPRHVVSKEPAGRGGAAERLGSRLFDTAPVQAQVKHRLEEMLRAADSTMEKRLQRVSTELAQADSELLQQRAHSQHLAQEKRELSERERALSRQVDTAIMVIATLRGQLTQSEMELERKEREIISIHHFLEAAIRHEMCGKLRLQNFIENILQRIALAEKLLEYHQRALSGPNCKTCTVSNPKATAKNGPKGITKSKSAEGFLASGVPAETRGPSPQRGRAFPKPSKERPGYSANHSRPDHQG